MDDTLFLDVLEATEMPKRSWLEWVFYHLAHFIRNVSARTVDCPVGYALDIFGAASFVNIR